jgi:hypothetical protein
MAFWNLKRGISRGPVGTLVSDAADDPAAHRQDAAHADPAIDRAAGGRCGRRGIALSSNRQGLPADDPSARGGGRATADSSADRARLDGRLNNGAAALRQAVQLSADHSPTDRQDAAAPDLTTTRARAVHGFNDGAVPVRPAVQLPADDPSAYGSGRATGDSSAGRAWLDSRLHLRATAIPPAIRLPAHDRQASRPHPAAGDVAGDCPRPFRCVNNGAHSLRPPAGLSATRGSARRAGQGASPRNYLRQLVGQSGWLRSVSGRDSSTGLWPERSTFLPLRW